MMLSAKYGFSMSISDVTLTQYLNIPNFRPEKGVLAPSGQKAPSWEWSLQTCDGPRYRLTGNGSEKNVAENIRRPGPGSRPKRCYNLPRDEMLQLAPTRVFHKTRYCINYSSNPV